MKVWLGLLVFLGASVSIFWLLQDERVLVLHPKGLIAREELRLIGTNIGLMLLVVVPTLVLLFVVAWKYRASSTKAKYEEEANHKPWKELILWAIPSAVVAVMAVITWKATHKLDPYKPLTSDQKPLTIQVVALDWKWLFIYPEQGIASVNFVQFPAKRPIHFALSADGSPMNSFWIPELSGQIYSMTGMVTPLHLMADGEGEYRGRAAEINGRGFADMTFVAKSCSEEDFGAWVKKVQQSPTELSKKSYEKLLTPSENHPVSFYSQVEDKLFEGIMKKYMAPGAM